MKWSPRVLLVVIVVYALLLWLVDGDSGPYCFFWLGTVVARLLIWGRLWPSQDSPTPPEVV